MFIEACIDSYPSGLAAQLGGADRVELCDNLADGGTTPSHGALALALEQLTIPVFPIIRPRGGSFCYSADEIAVMERDVVHAAELGAPGLVIGALTPTGEIDEDTVGLLQAVAEDCVLTFHRAFDVCRDPHQALETLIRLGVQRVLTSGQRATAQEGRQLIAELVRQAGDRIVIMAGGDIDEHNAAGLVRETGVREIHVRGTSPVREPMVFHDHAVPFRRPLPVDEAMRSVTDPVRLLAIRRALIDGQPSIS
jgi:copper homeostasis protein